MVPTAVFKRSPKSLFVQGSLKHSHVLPQFIGQQSRDAQGLGISIIQGFVVERRESVYISLILLFLQRRSLIQEMSF